MSEEISATGQVRALSSTDFATSYQTPNEAARQGVSTSPAPQVAGAPAKAAVTTTTVAGAPTAATTTTTARQPTTDEINTAVAAANINLSGSNRTLDYRVDAVTGISITTIRNSQTGAVMQQIPGADIIALARMLAEWEPGKHMLLDLIA